MFGSKRNPPASFAFLAVMASLVMILAACTSTTFHWITPVATLDVAPADAADASAVETPEPVEEEAVAEATEEAATEGIEEGATPSSLTHALTRREECLDCHAVDGREPAPASHVKYETDDICLYCHMPEEGEAVIPPLPDPVTTEFCLTCHGPFEDLTALTAGYTVADGTEANPHVYVPHDKTSILKCNLCHDPHPLPVQASDEIPQASLQYCYAACHHEFNFEPCTNCH